CTNRTARSRTSGENLLFLLMAPFSQKLEPPQNPGRFSGRDCGKSKHGEFWHSFSKGYLNPGLRGEAPFQVLRSMRRIIALAA
ncbi:hypothetical protein, partial [Pseudomonas aeruginosa]|uniref:hypothetical protein n=1 Tax=Pseudomonas aeruginosa TaxID=287 RepID=UPI002230B7C0